jgi:hypothetical protein
MGQPTVRLPHHSWRNRRRPISENLPKLMGQPMSVRNFFGMEFRDLGAWESIPGFGTLSGKCSEAGKSVPKPGMDFTFPGLGTLS